MALARTLLADASRGVGAAAPAERRSCCAAPVRRAHWRRRPPRSTYHRVAGGDRPPPRRLAGWGGGALGHDTCPLVVPAVRPSSAARRPRSSSYAVTEGCGRGSGGSPAITAAGSSRSEVVDRVTGCHRPQAGARRQARCAGHHPPSASRCPTARCAHASMLATTPSGGPAITCRGWVADQPAAGGDRGLAPRRRRDGPGALARPAPARPRQQRGAVSEHGRRHLGRPARPRPVGPAQHRARAPHPRHYRPAHRRRASNNPPPRSGQTTVLAVSPLLRRAAGAAETSNAPPDRRLRAVLLDQLAAATPDKGRADLG